MIGKTAAIIETLALLRPYDIVGHSRTRIGNHMSDGGYVVLEKLLNQQSIISYGVGPDVSFDYAMAQRGHHVWMFDHTVDGPPKPHKNFVFTPEGVAATDLPEQMLYSIETHAKRFGLDNQNIMLKMDIEGYEWDVLNAASDETIVRCDFLLIEFHRFSLIADPAVRVLIDRCLSRLNRTHTLFHVSANNSAPLQIIEGVAVAPLLEVSYVRTDLVQRECSKTIYPTEIDSINTSKKHFIPLLFFPFAPLPEQTWAALPDHMSSIFGKLAKQYEFWNGAK